MRKRTTGMSPRLSSRGLLWCIVFACGLLLLTWVGVAGLQSGAGPVHVALGIAGGVAVAASVIVIWLSAQRSSRSIREVTEGIGRIEAGDLDHRIRTNATGETSDLVLAFNRMATSLTSMMGDLSGERDKLSAVMETMSDGVIVVDSSGDVELLNGAAATLFGVDPGVGPETPLSVGHDHELRQLVAACRVAGEPQYAEIILTAGRRTVSAVATPLEEQPGGAVLVTLHDLTELRQVETSRREFVSNVSHELRTPLSSIKAMAETLEDGGLDDSSINADFVKRIHIEADRMTTLVNDLLELTSLQSGQADMKPEQVDISSVIREEGSRYVQVARGLGIEANVSVPEDLPRVVAQEDRMRQVVRNLLDNALKFTPENGRIDLSASANHDVVEVRVSDNGLGIPPESLPHIFERFYKVERSRRNEGSGLGLAIVKNIVQAYGGEVSVESREGEGSTFSLTLMVAETADVPVVGAPV